MAFNPLVLLMGKFYCISAADDMCDAVLALPGRAARYSDMLMCAKHASFIPCLILSGHVCWC